MKQRIRYAQVGLGGRHRMFRDAIIGDFAEGRELVGLCDPNEGRLQLSRHEVFEQTGQEVPGYPAEEFDRMIRETHPDYVIVTTKDCTHDTYICRAMELGCDVITEKPMTIDEKRCGRILETQQRTGRQCRVTFNYRYAPPRTQIKDLLMSGVIGDIISVDFHWMLDTVHGADYFRRWHRNKENSGGLLVHKATHHFDLINWWLSSVPETVYASGHRKFYRPKTAERLGLSNRAQRCRGCAEAATCNFYLGLEKNEKLRRLYLECEHYDGYYRDQCVFSDNIDIEDSMSVFVSYRNGVKMAYSLNAFSPWEGYIITFNGSQGRLEHTCQETAYINADGRIPGELSLEGTHTRICPHWDKPYTVDVWTGKGGHGGGDAPLIEDLFSRKNTNDQYLRVADQRAGAWSIMTGIAANHSIAEGRPIRIDELLPDIDFPDYPDVLSA